MTHHRKCISVINVGFNAESQMFAYSVEHVSQSNTQAGRLHNNKTRCSFPLV